jgi:hypothetical protein
MYLAHDEDIIAACAADLSRQTPAHLLVQYHPPVSDAEIASECTSSAPDHPASIVFAV